MTDDGLLLYSSDRVFKPSSLINSSARNTIEGIYIKANELINENDFQKSTALISHSVETISLLLELNISTIIQLSLNDRFWFLDMLSKADNNVSKSFLVLKWISRLAGFILISTDIN